MREVFQNELDGLADKLTAMAEKVVTAIDKASEALHENNLELAEEVIAADAAIDRLQLELDKSAAEILALQAPVAADLRVVISSLRMSASLERMGDLARHVAQQVRIRYPDSAVPAGFEPVFSRMTEAAGRIARAIHHLVSNPGLEAVPTIDDLDESLDTLHLRVFSQISDSDIKPAEVADVTLLSRYLERFGDHAVSVAQRIEYLLTGNWDSKLIPGTD
ncbi:MULTISPECIES: phosphate signaling complex protein PhoU [Brevibacterium]|jgi:phosphate transport system protein|uniref:Phosphate-specific transport system accessory protein PhoU n=1 Tax=Brevibacterium salitolerans TaxID=1403566 RepID=A0ABN2WI19_9MICO|nr:phosphate signaling complex protein PhoU [Brevibacterium sp.]